MSSTLKRRALAFMLALMAALFVVPSMAFADDSSDTVAFTVYEAFQTGTDADGNPEYQYAPRKTFTQSDLEALKSETTSKYGYAMQAKAGVSVLATENYVAVSDILKKAKVTLAENETMGFTENAYGEEMSVYSKWTASYEDVYGDLKFFPYYSSSDTQNTDDATNSPAVIALAYGSASITTNAKEAYEGISSYDATDTPRFMAGQTEDSYTTDGLRPGNNFPSSISGVVIYKDTSCSVYAKSATADTAKLVKTLSFSDMLAAATTNDSGVAVNWNKTNAAVAKTYAPIEDVLAAAGVQFAEGDTVRVADITDFGQNVTYAELHDSANPMNYYPNRTLTEAITDGAVEVGAMLGLNYIKTVSIGDYTIIDDAVKAAVQSGTFEYGYQWMPGATESQYTNDENTGKRMVSNANVITVTMANVSSATVSVADQTYTGKALTPAATVTMPDGTVLTAGTDYAIAYKNNTNAGTATATITGEGDYCGTVTKTFKINKASQAITLGKTKVTKSFKAKKKTKALAAKKTINVKSLAKVSGAKTAVTFKKANKVGKKKITVAAKTGKITVKKGLKKGTYKVKVKVSAADNANYNAATDKVVTVVVKVK